VDTNRWQAPQDRFRTSTNPHPELEAMWPAAGSLIDYASTHLPVEISDAEQDNGWLQIAWLPARITDGLFSIMNLGLLGLHADACALLRVMADHAITFAWLAADETPPARYNAWFRYSLQQAQRQKKHVEDLGGSFQSLPEFDSVDTMTPWLNSAAAARACDKFWQPFLEGVIQPGTLNSFEGIYASAFRQSSYYVHPTIAGGFDYLDRDAAGHVKGLTSCAPRRGIYAEAVHLQTLAMYVLTVRFAEDEIQKMRVLWHLIARAQREFLQEGN
jgi:hypothetical protein